jgi:hypothetical protein
MTGRLEILSGPGRRVAGAQERCGGRKCQQGESHSELASHEPMPLFKSRRETGVHVDGCISPRSTMSECNRILFVIDAIADEGRVTLHGRSTLLRECA